MYFKKWFETVELLKPRGKVSKSSIILNKSTNIASEAIQFKWKTKFGNVVKLLFKKKSEDEYEVLFYVNDSLIDNSSETENNKRDPEILSTVMYLLKRKSDEIGAKSLTFNAFASKNDIKVLRNLDLKDLPNIISSEIASIKDIIEDYSVEMIPPSQELINLSIKFNKPTPQPRPDVNKEQLISLLDKILIAIEDKNLIHLEDYIEMLQKDTFSNFKLFPIALGYNPVPLIEKIIELRNIFKSMTPEGFSKNKNRRASIYNRLMNAYMSQNWNIEVRGNYFHLNRKNID